MNRPKSGKEKTLASEEKYHHIFENLFDAAFLADTETGIIQECNLSAPVLLGRSREEIVGMHYLQIHPPDKAEEYERRFEHVKMGRGETYDCEIIRKDGTIMPVAASGSPLTVGGRRLSLALFRDITDRKLTEHRLLESEEKYRRLFENLYDAAFLADPETGKILECNQQGTVLLGRSREEIVGMHYLQIHPPDKADEYIERFTKHTEAGYAVDYDGEAIRKDGTVVPVIASSCPLNIGGRRLSLGLFRDITDRKRAEQALKESESRHRELFNNASNAVFVTDLDGKIAEANQAAQTLSGYTIKEMTNMNIAKMLSAESRELAKEMHRALLKDETARSRRELEIVRKDGIRVPIELASRPIYENGQPAGWHTMFTDISQQKRFQENMHFYIEQVIQAQEEERKRIARELHDETTQSLATLALDIEATARIYNNLPEAVVGRLEELREKTSLILDGVRRFSHELRPDVLDQLGLIPALELLTGELRQEDIRGRLAVTGSERRLSSDAELALFRIAQEALTNIKKHARATEVVVNIQFTQKKVKLSVTDNGTGFVMPKVPGDLAGQGKLGLMGIRERVRLLNGTLSIKSQEGKGTMLLVNVKA